jgi:hypothetical protein
MTHQNTLAAKTVSDYVSTPEIDKLAQQFGTHLERMTAQAKCLMAAALLDHMAAENCSYYTIQNSLESVDPDCILGHKLSNLVVKIANASDAQQLNHLVMAIVALHSGDIANSAYSS